MAEPKSFAFEFKELAEMMVKNLNLHEGLWGVYLEFGIQAGNLNIGPSPEAIVPVAMIPVLKVGIQKFDKPSQLTVDAAEVNPPSKQRPKTKKT